MTFEYNNNLYNVNIVRKNNKNTYIRVKNNEIYVTTSYFSTDKRIYKLINENRDAVIKMINKSNKKEDNSFKIFGKRYTIVYGESFKEVEISDNIICAYDNKMLNKYMSKYINNVYGEHLDYWYNKFEEKIPIPNLKIRKMTSRWGVCNLRNKNVTLNLELFKYDIKCLDYVIVHELSHFIFPNHSKDFWNLVGKYYPNYKEIRKILKDN